MQNLLEGLNEAQLAAATHVGGPLIILAGAGTGKTTVITHRIAWLIEQRHAAPENILALTFTDKAAGEMEERVDLLLPMGYVELQISTFHAFCEKLLREYGVEIGLPRDFRVLTELDAWLLARQGFDRFELEHYRPLGNPTKYLRGLLTHFSRAKDAGVGPDEYMSFAESRMADLDGAHAGEEVTAEVARMMELARAYQTYQQVLLDQDGLDFGDLILYTLKLLKERPKVLKDVRERFTHVLVDEFQDTNLAQYEIVRLIAAPRNEITVVGDDDQSIYRFRGATIANIMRFREDYPEARAIVLNENYRSVQRILDASHAFIQANNPNRLEAKEEDLSKKLSSNREGQGRFHHLHCGALEDAAAEVARQITDLRKEDEELAWGDFAVLVRSNDAASPYVAELERRQMPYQFLALSGLYLKRPVLDMVALLRSVNDPYDGPAMHRTLSMPIFDLGDLLLARLGHEARKKGVSLQEAAMRFRELDDVEQEEAASLDRAIRLIEGLRERAREGRASELLLLAAKESGYMEHLNGLSERARIESFRYLQQLYERMRGFEARHEHPVLRNFLEDFQHERDAGEDGALSFDLDSGPDMVKIMTVHASKGLEFRHVFVVDLVAQRFPTNRRRDAIPLPNGLSSEPEPEGDPHLEEERRLFYVAMTRAKDGLFLVSAEDYGGSRKRKPSKFLAELDIQPERRGAEAEDFKTAAESSGKEEAHPERPVVIELPKQFSFTQLAAFRTCPLQYKFAHVYKIPVLGRWTLSFGKTMHGALQEFFETWIERKSSQQGSLFGETIEAAGVPVALEELMEMYARAWHDDWFVNDVQREEYREKGRKSLRAYYAMVEKDPPQPLHLEQGFTLKLGSVVLKGRIDRIDRLEDGIEIIDYKTGTPKTEKTLDREGKEQLMLYQLAARDVLGLNPLRLTYHYLEDNSQVSFIGSEMDLLDLQEGIVDRVQRIGQSSFPPTPGFHCKFCDFADICEYRKG